MKNLFITIILFLICVVSIAQEKPKWISQLPKSNKTITYKTGIGIGFTLDEAKNKAFADILIKAASQVGGIGINSQDIFQSLQNGKNFDVISKEYKIPINIVCEHKEETNTKYTYYILGQVPISKIDGWQWDDFRDCGADLHKVDRTALAWSILPGGGQFYKNHNGLAWTIIGSEVLLIGGGVTCYFIGQNQQDIMSNHKTSYNDYQSAKSTYNTVTTLQPWLYGAAAVVYVVNLATAYWINDNRDNKSISIVPSIMPTNDNLAVGIGINYKF